MVTRGSPINAGARPAFYDRNPAQKGNTDSSQVSENTATTEKWSYTVPSDKQAQITTMIATLLTLVAATSTTTTDLIQAYLQLTPNVGNAVTIIEAAASTPAVSAGDDVNNLMGSTMLLQAGDNISAKIFFAGDAMGAGRMQVRTAATITEYDA